MQNFRFGALLLLTGAVVLSLNMCKKNVEPIEFNAPPVVVEGEQNLLVKAARYDQTPLSTWTLTYTNPSGAEQSVNVTGDVFIIENLVNGTWTVEASKNGFIGMIKKVNVSLPADETEDYQVGTNLFITKKNSPVNIEPDQGGTVTAPPTGTGGSGTGTNPTTVTIPAGALPAGNTVPITVTPIPSDPTSAPPTTVNGSMAGDAVLFEPTGTTFEIPIKVDVPTNIPSGLVGQIPVTFDYVDEETGEFTGEKVNMTVTPNGKLATAEIDHFSIWQVVNGVVIDTVEAWQAWNIAASGGCGEAVQATYTAQGTYGINYVSLLNIPPGQTTVSVLATSQVYPAIEFYKFDIEARGKWITYTLENATTGAPVEQFNIPMQEVIFRATDPVWCHTSGGK